RGYAALLRGAFGSPYTITETLVIAVPLTLAGISVAVAFRTGLFNIGAQGQLLVGALAAGWTGAQFPELPGILLLPLTLVSAVLAGGAWGAIAGWLKAARGVNEVITTIMQNYTVVFVMHCLRQNGPMTAPNAAGTPATSPVGITLAAVLFAAFARGGTIMQADAGVSSHLVEVVEATVLLVIAAEAIVRALAVRRGTPAEALA